MLTVSTACFCNPCARAESHQQERARKLCSATLIRAKREVKIASPEESGRIVTHENVAISSNGNYERRSSKLADKTVKMPNVRVIFERTHSYLRLLPACSKIARTNVKVGKTKLLSLVQLEHRGKFSNDLLVG